MEILEKYKFLTQNHNGFKYSERWLNKNCGWVLIDIDKYSLKNNLDVLPFKQKLYCTINNSLPKKCYCGNNSSFISINEGYGIYCSNKCSTNSESFNEKRKKTSLEKYGTEFYTQTKEYVEKVKKANLEKWGVEYTTQSELVKDKIKQTNLEKWGTEYSSQSEIVKDKIKQTKKEKYNNEYYNNSSKIKNSLIYKYKNTDELNSFLNKQKETNLERWGFEYANQNDSIKKHNLEKTIESVKKKWGVDNVFKLEFIKERSKQTNLEKFGFDNYSKSDEFKSNIKKIRIDNILEQLPKGYTLNDSNGSELNLKCELLHNFKVSRQLFFLRKKMGHIICSECNPINKQHSHGEKEIYEYVSTLTKNVIENDRKLLGKKELDVYMPSHNVGIEYNGLYWHSELYYDKNYHLNKTKECEKQGVSLIHVFEDEWLYKPNIVKSIIKNKIGFIDKKIYARKCKIKEISAELSRKFLNENHIQGYVNSSIKLGLFYEDELVSIMTFGSLRKALGSKHKSGHWEMLRFCNKLNHSIIGGSSKLFKSFIENYTPIEVVSYSDNRWFNGDMYKKLGFNFISETKPNYYYIIKGVRENRFKHRKDQLIKNGFDSNKTEHEIMLEQGFYRIYDCGNKKWIYNN